MADKVQSSRRDGKEYSDGKTSKEKEDKLAGAWPGQYTPTQLMTAIIRLLMKTHRQASSRQVIRRASRAKEEKEAPEPRNIRARTNDEYLAWSLRQGQNLQRSERRRLRRGESLTNFTKQRHRGNTS